MSSCEGHHGHLGAVSGSCLEILPREGAPPKQRRGFWREKELSVGWAWGGGRGKTATCYFVVLWNSVSKCQIRGNCKLV